MISIKIGEQKAVNFDISSAETGLPISLVNSTILFQLREKEEQTLDFILEKSITQTSNPNSEGKIHDASNGKFNVFFKADDTKNLSIGKIYYYTLWKITGNLKEVISSDTDELAEFIVYPD